MTRSATLILALAALAPAQEPPRGGPPPGPGRVKPVDGEKIWKTEVPVTDPKAPR